MALRMLDDLTAIEEKFLERVWEHFRETGSWPRTALLEREFRTDGNAKKIAAQIGRDYLVWEHRSDGSGLCYLTLRTIATRKGSEQTIENFLAAIRHLGRRYADAGGDVSVSAGEFVTELGFSEAEARRIADLIRYETAQLTRGSSWPPAPDWPSFQVDRLAMYLENVSSVDEYWRIYEWFEQEEREASFLFHHGPVGPRIQEVPREWSTRVSGRVFRRVAAETTKGFWEGYRKWIAGLVVAGLTAVGLYLLARLFGILPSF